MERAVKHIITALFFAAALTGCASSLYKTARANANQVQNGMAISQVITILGIPPSDRGADFVEWRRGDAQYYNGTPRGSIRFEIRDGLVINVPPGGIFSKEAEQRLNDAWMVAYREKNASRLAEESKEAARKAVLAALDEEARARKHAEEEEKTSKEIEMERAAAKTAWFGCNEKIMCSKVFALAQIYVAQNADQKIQVATDTIIQTYNPTEHGKIGMSVIKTPRQGTAEVVSITPSCKDSDYGDFASICRRERTRIYKGFRPFVESQLAK